MEDIGIYEVSGRYVDYLAPLLRTCFITSATGRSSPESISASC